MTVQILASTFVLVVTSTVWNFSQYAACWPCFLQRRLTASVNSTWRYDFPTQTKGVHWYELENAVFNRLKTLISVVYNLVFFSTVCEIDDYGSEPPQKKRSKYSCN